MAVNSAWRGAIEFKVSGIPIPVNLRFYPRVSGSRAQGFTLLSPAGNPVQQKYLEIEGTWKGSIGECARGINTGERIVQLEPEIVTAINDSDRTTLAEPDSFAPLDSIDLALASASYYVMPDNDVAGAAKSAQVIWNGLLDNGLAYITKIVLRAGSSDRIIAIYADGLGLKAVALPFADELNQEPTAPWEPNAKVGEMFRDAVETSYEVRDFDPSEYVSEHQAHRDEVIAQALAGEKIAAPVEVKPKDEGPDLMSLLEASVAEVKKPKRTKVKA